MVDHHCGSKRRNNVIAISSPQACLEGTSLVPVVKDARGDAMDGDDDDGCR
jgi:hypothetical protein